jgi:hypothetical protein
MKTIRNFNGVRKAEFCRCGFAYNVHGIAGQGTYGRASQCFGQPERRCRGGFLHADGYAGFNGLYEPDAVTGDARLVEVACWAHCPTFVSAEAAS